jgi:hypothetical protein
MHDCLALLSRSVLRKVAKKVLKRVSAVYPLRKKARMATATVHQDNDTA